MKGQPITKADFDTIKYLLAKENGPEQTAAATGLGVDVIRKVNRCTNFEDYLKKKQEYRERRKANDSQETNPDLNDDIFSYLEKILRYLQENYSATTRLANLLDKLKTTCDQVEYLYKGLGGGNNGA